LREFQDLPKFDAQGFRRSVEQRERRLRPGSLGRFEWLMYRGSETRALGWVSLRMQERDPESGEVGYSVIESERNQGFASEAVRAIIAEGFSAARLARIRAFCIPENVPSRVVLEKIGFTQKATLPHGAMVHGKPVDVLAFVLER